VDWEIIALYTCPNPKCVPDFSNNQYYMEEFAHIQMSFDFQ
jgi:hypothetical protein